MRKILTKIELLLSMAHFRGFKKEYLHYVIFDIIGSGNVVKKKRPFFF